MEHKGRIKLEFYNKLLCCACLSSDRTLSPIGSYLEIYQNICDNSCLDEETKINLCWECIAELKKIKVFKEKVTKAQRLLRNCNLKAENLPICLSNLTIAETNHVDIVLSTKSEIEHETEIKIEYELETEIIQLEIKQEKDLVPENGGYDPIDDSERDNDIHLEDLKSENNTLDEEIIISKEKKTKNTTSSEKVEKPGKNYRIINNSTNTLLRRVKIDQNDVNVWREKLRIDNYYKSWKIKCQKCMVRYTTLRLKRHNKAFHDKVREYSCDICQSYFSTKPKLANHVLDHYFLNECKACGYQCYSSHHFKKHIRSHKRTVQCVECEASCSSRREFLNHFRMMHSKWYCDHCGKPCISRNSLVRHIRVNHDLRCYICKIDFKKNYSLRLHNKFKHVKAPTEDAFCVSCNKQFDNVHVYQQHVKNSVAHAAERNKEVVERKRVTCPDCGKTYALAKTMRDHFRQMHSRHPKYYCKEHDKAFAGRSGYLGHMQYVHEKREKTKDKMCNICGRGFHQTPTLKKHMRTHTGEKPYACAHCDARFAQRTAMLSHVKHIHLKESRKGRNQGPLVG